MAWPKGRPRKLGGLAMAEKELVKSQGEKDRQREWERREARKEAAKTQGSIIVHAPAQK